jgi:hypothetical protein
MVFGGRLRRALPCCSRWLDKRHSGSAALPVPKCLSPDGLRRSIARRPRHPSSSLWVYVADQRLLAERIFLAHAASLRHTSLFASVNFETFIYSFFSNAR